MGSRKAGCRGVWDEPQLGSRCTLESFLVGGHKAAAGCLLPLAAAVFTEETPF